MLLVILPYLICKKGCKTRPLFGKVSYFTVLLACFRCIRPPAELPQHPKQNAFWRCGLYTILNLFSTDIFWPFCALVVLNRKNVFQHQRYMIGTWFIVLTAINIRSRPVLSHQVPFHFLTRTTYFWIAPRVGGPNLPGMPWQQKRKQGRARWRIKSKQHQNDTQWSPLTTI